MVEIRGIRPGHRITRDNMLGFGAKQFPIQRISSRAAGDPVEQGPGQPGATVFQPKSSGVNGWSEKIPLQ